MNEIKPKDKPHNVDNLVITCSDHRYQQTISQILRDEYQVDIESSDRIAYPGSSKAVSDGTLIPPVQTLHRLHNFQKVWLVDHSDCGGFGGLEAYDNDEQKEIAAHFESFERATGAIHKVLPKLIVVSFVVSLDGEGIKPNTA